METQLLKRTGDAPLAFVGELISEVSSKTPNSSRWHEIGIYRTAQGNWVLEIVYRTQWEGELDNHVALWLTHTPGEMLDIGAALKHYDPTSHVQGYPPNEFYRDRQARLLADMQRRYDDLVTQLLDSPEFALRIA